LVSYSTIAHIQYKLLHILQVINISCINHIVLTARVVHFFAERVINVWNCLPPSVDYSTLATFRRSIDGIDFTSSLKCDTD